MFTFPLETEFAVSSTSTTMPLSFVISVGFESRERDELVALARTGTAMAEMSPAKNEVGRVFIVRSVRNAIDHRCTPSRLDAAIPLCRSEFRVGAR